MQVCHEGSASQALSETSSVQNCPVGEDITIINSMRSLNDFMHIIMYLHCNNERH